MAQWVRQVQLGQLGTPLLAGGVLITVLWLLKARRNSVAAQNNEPPVLPYWIPWLGHAVSYASGSDKVFRAARNYTPDQGPVSIVLGGNTIYVVTKEADVREVFRNKQDIQFEPLVEWGLACIFGLSADGVRALRFDMDGKGDMMIYNQHAFYANALKEGPELEQLNRNFCRELYKLLDQFDEQVGDGATEVGLRDWSRTLLGTAATTALLGPTMLERICPDILDCLWQFEVDIFKFVFGLPRWAIPNAYKNRDKIIDAFEEYLKDPRNKEGAVPMIPEREVHMRISGMNGRDISACSFSVWSGANLNSIPSAFWMLLYIITIPGLVDRLREEIAPVFTPPDGVPSQPVRVHHLGRLVRNSPLLRSTFYEVLRTCGGTVSNRVVTQDTIVAGRLLKKSTPVMLAARPQHMDPAIWGEDYGEFVPDRFIRVDDKGGKFGSHGDRSKGEIDAKEIDQRRLAKERSMRPFGGGTSLCPGRFFASYEVWALVACLIWRYDMSVKEGEKIPTVDLKTPNLGVMSPTHDLKIRLVKRKRMYESVGCFVQPNGMWRAQVRV